MNEPHDSTGGTVADLVRRAAAARPEHPALRWHERQLTWAELDREVDAVAAGLRALELPADAHPARVAVALPNVAEFAVALFAVLRAGLVAVPVNPGYTTREVGHILRDSGAAALIGTGHTVTSATETGAELRTFPLKDMPRGEWTADVSVSPADLAVLLYTSGSAGAPKGAMLTHRALLANHAQLAGIDPPPVTGDDTVLLAVPLFHAYGLNSGLIAVAYHAATGVLVERFDPGESLDLIERHRVTVVAGVPTMYVAWSLMGERLAPAFAAVRTAVCGAAPLDASTARRFAEGAGRQVHVGYGLTETAPVLTSTLASETAKVGSIGRPIPGVGLRLIQSDGEPITIDGPLEEPDEDEYAPNTPGTDPGEIVVRGANLFTGYWPDGREGPGEDGWWATGDVAYADADGDLFLVDRLGELILVSGFNVYPHEVEQVLDGHPAVREAAVLGVAHPYTGQAVKAFVVREPGTSVDADELTAYAERNLARFKCPTAVEFVDELPHSATGKVRKAALRD
ncbi:AMP-binding protein [Virgisporangium aliadipatigenens]|uniref:AMP-binding protein n=1 Tax=Virgisporangium aliadipatigenens TaxID=741659 RepID=UPI001EF35B57|nr:AMP-binding protein [Virgisporangium aliadipatigenens]